jgi:hypothetical protein
VDSHNSCKYEVIVLDGEFYPVKEASFHIDSSEVVSIGTINAATPRKITLSATMPQPQSYDSQYDYVHLSIDDELHIFEYVGTTKTTQKISSMWIDVEMQAMGHSVRELG